MDVGREVKVDRRIEGEALQAGPTEAMSLLYLAWIEGKLQVDEVTSALGGDPASDIEVHIVVSRRVHILPRPGER